MGKVLGVTLFGEYNSMITHFLSQRSFVGQNEFETTLGHSTRKLYILYAV